jgi:hypothetical protein
LISNNQANLFDKDTIPVLLRGRQTASFMTKQQATESINSNPKPGNWGKELIPIFLVFPFSLLISYYHHGDAPNEIWPIFYRNILRFFRYAFFLCLPLYVLPRLYKHLLERGKETLIQLREPPVIAFQPLKHWLFRPFQGIGIGFLFATKLLALIQTISGPLISTTPPFISGDYHLHRILLVTLITVLIALLLSVLWTLDDMGIRFHNRKDQELKMIGKYAGTLMPVIFGLFGLFSLLTRYPKESALLHVIRIILVFYPPLVLFVVTHLHFIKGKNDFHCRKDLLKRGGVWQE